MSINETDFDHTRRINDVFCYIDEHLEEELSLQIIADVACFSPFHFHRLFKLITGETPNAYVSRRRIERSALELMHRPASISAIALKYGFNDLSSYTRAFTRFYGQSPSAFRKQNHERYTKIAPADSKICQTAPDYECYFRVIDHLKSWIDMNASIEIKELPKLEIAYLSSIGSQNLSASFQNLLQWARSRGLMNERTKVLTIYHDSLKVTDEQKARMSACITLETAIKTDNGVGHMTIEAGRYVIGSYRITPDQFDKSWGALFLWIKENGYQKADREAFEIYHNNFNEHPDKIAIVDFCIPIV